MRTAARDAGTSATNLWMKIRRLEHDLGGQLLSPDGRHHSTIKVTPLGTAVLAAVQKMSGTLQPHTTSNPAL